MKKRILSIIIAIVVVCGIALAIKYRPKTAHERMVETVTKIKQNIAPKITEEEQAKTDAAIQEGREAAQIQIAIERENEEAAEKIIRQIEAEFK